MVDLVLSSDQADLLRGGSGEVVFRDPTGKCVAVGKSFESPLDVTSEEATVVAECLRRRNSNQKRYTTEEVLAYLESLPKE